MNRKMAIKATLIAGFFLLAFGGWLLHLRIHPLANGASNIIPALAGACSAFLLPFLFCFRRTIALAYIVNGFLVILGTITMAYFSIAHFQGTISALNIILNTTLADICILWARFAIGLALFNLEFLKSETDTAAKGRFLRYPHMGWWWVHLFALSAVYILGNIFWK